jgi:valyl-tRNA synthetase
LYLHSLVRTAEGAKMSKTKGTGVDPLQLTQQFGTDALRYMLASMAAPGTDIALTEDRILGARAFANKIWNAARFLFLNLDKFEESGARLEELAAPEVREKAPYAYHGSVPLVDAWMFARLAATVELLNEALANYRFHEAAQGVYQFFWGDLCDWYIEWVKPELQSADRERATVAWKNLFAVFNAALRLLHPFMPFLTEELWHQLPQRAGAKSIALDKFPEAHERWKNAKALKEVAAIQEVVMALRNIRGELKLDPKKKVAADFSTSDAGTADFVQANRGVIERFAVLSELRSVPRQRSEAKSGAVRSTSTFDVRIAYADTVDMVAEQARLKREIEGLQKAIASKERQLGDETFRSRAPEKIIKGLEVTLAERSVELQKLQDRLSQIEKES